MAAIAVLGAEAVSGIAADFFAAAIPDQRLETGLSAVAPEQDADFPHRPWHALVRSRVQAHGGVPSH